MVLARKIKKSSVSHRNVHIQNVQKVTRPSHREHRKTREEIERVQQYGISDNSSTTADNTQRQKKPSYGSVAQLNQVALMAKAKIVTNGIRLGVSWLLPIQLYFGILSFFGLLFKGATDLYLWDSVSWIVTSFIDGENIYFIGLGAVLLVWLGSMAIAIIAYLLTGVQCFNKTSLIVWIGCSILYFIPILNIFPWIYLWLFVVTRDQNP